MKKKSPKSKKVLPNYELDGEDAEFLAAIENGEVELVRSKTFAHDMEMAKQAAKNYFAKKARVSFRISEADLRNIKRMAASEGLPYQTFLTSIIHKLTTGQISLR